MGKKGNITGEVFDIEVIKQIEARQNFLGADFKQDKQLIYQNNKTAFVRLASSVDAGVTTISPNNATFNIPSLQANPNPFITPQTVSTEQSSKVLSDRGLPLTLSGNTLAQQCVLFGGTVSVNMDSKTFQPKYGVGEGTFNSETNTNFSPGGFGDQEIDLTSPSAYGWGGLGSQGYRPMPGIIDANVTFYNRGALAKATVNCKVYSVEQLQIFDLLYFRIGYTMLLEWGHNIYIDNNIDNGSGNYAPNLVNRPTFNTKPFQKFFDNKSTQNDIIDSIKSQRFDDSYNYDAMLGKVVNFSWKFNTDGSYDITLNLVGLGDVIEALKINTSVAGNTGAKPSDLLSDEEKRIQELEKQAEAAQLAAENAREEFSNELASLEGKEAQDVFSAAYDFFIETIKNTSVLSTLSDATYNTVTVEDGKFYGDDGQSIDDYIGGDGFKVPDISGGAGFDAVLRKLKGTEQDFQEQIASFNRWKNTLEEELKRQLYNANLPNNGDITVFRFDTNTQIKFSNPKRSGFISSGNIYIPRSSVSFNGSATTALTNGSLSRNFTPKSDTLSSEKDITYTNTTDGIVGKYVGIQGENVATFNTAFKLLLDKARDYNQNVQDIKKAQSDGAARVAAANAREQAANNKLKALQKEIALLKDRLQSFPASSAEYRDKSTFNRKLYEWTQDIKNKGNKNTGVINEPTVLNNIQKQSLARYFKELNPTLPNEGVQTRVTVALQSRGTLVGDLALQIDNYIKDLNKNKNPDFCKYSFSYAAQDSEVAGQTLKVDQYYVRLGYMLEWIQNNLLIYSGEKNFQVPKGIGMSVANGVPYLNINTDVNSNVLKYFPTQISSDPKICLIPIKFVNEYKGLKSTKITTDSKTKKIQSSTITEDLKVNWSAFCDSKSTTQADLSNYFIEGEPDAARLMNIMVNIDYAAAILAQNVDSNGKVTLLDFINSLCLGISDSLGNINKLNAVYDGETNEVKIVDENGINITQNQINNNPSNGISIPKIGKFRVYGVQPGAEGSFVTNVDFQVQLPPNMASMATISAQSSGNIVGENATGLSRLNTGLIDRIIPSKLDAESLKNQQTRNTTQDINVIFGDNLQNMNKFVEELYENNKYETKNVEALKSINRDVSLYETGRTAELNKQPAPFFIPFNLSLDMDGLSGMRNYERFSITEDILPYSYRSSDSLNGGVIDFIIKGISHNISNNQWKTKIESQTISSIRNPKTRS